MYANTGQGHSDRGSRVNAHRKGPTAADVARAAQVSTATVSRAFNNPEKVAADVRDRVLRVAKQLGWFPHPAGAALASRRSWLIGAVIPTLDNDVFARQVAALQARAMQEGMTVLIGSFNYDPEQSLAHVRTMLARGVEALAIVGELHPPELFQMIEARGIPYVLTYGWRPDIAHPAIGFDNACAYARITRHLLDLGHERFGVIHQPLHNNERVGQRLLGIRQALAERGLGLRPRHVVEGPARLEFGAAGLERILAAEGPVPTAIICGNDALAIGALHAARARGLNVPRDLSITGFDDSEIAAWTEPPLTTYAVDYAAIGQRAAEYLLARLEGRAADVLGAVGGGLVVRTSTAPPPG